MSKTNLDRMIAYVRDPRPSLHAKLFTNEEIADALRLLRDVLDGFEQLSPGPYGWCAIEDDDDQTRHVLDHLSRGSGRIHGIGLLSHPGTLIGSDPDHPERMTTLCWTGNGPKSEQNAKALCRMLHALTALRAAGLMGGG